MGRLTIFFLLKYSKYFKQKMRKIPRWSLVSLKKSFCCFFSFRISQICLFILIILKEKGKSRVFRIEFSDKFRVLRCGKLYDLSCLEFSACGELYRLLPPEFSEEGKLGAATLFEFPAGLPGNSGELQELSFPQRRTQINYINCVSRGGYLKSKTY